MKNASIVRVPSTSRNSKLCYQTDSSPTIMHVLRGACHLLW